MTTSSRPPGRQRRSRASRPCKSASPATAGGTSSPLRQHIDQNVSVAALDDLAEMGLSRARGVPRLLELAGSTPRLLPYIRVRLVLIDKEIVDARRAHRPCLHHRANSSTSSRASSSRYWMGGLFMKYADGPRNGPPMPGSWATLQ